MHKYEFAFCQHVCRLFRRAYVSDCVVKMEVESVLKAR